VIACLQTETPPGRDRARAGRSGGWNRPRSVESSWLSNPDAAAVRAGHEHGKGDSLQTEVEEPRAPRTLGPRARGQFAQCEAFLPPTLGASR